MREIKFRVWDGIKMTYPNEPNGDSGLFLLIGDSGYFSVQDHSSENFTKTKSSNGYKDLDILNSLDDDLKLMQFTGLKDKNGIHIYEGDICRLFGCNRKIIYSLGAFGYMTEDNENGMFVGIGLNYNFNWFGEASNGIEILGNIYENKNLLDE